MVKMATGMSIIGICGRFVCLGLRLLMSRRAVRLLFPNSSFGVSLMRSGVRVSEIQYMVF